MPTSSGWRLVTGGPITGCSGCRRHCCGHGDARGVAQTPPAAGYGSGMDEGPLANLGAATTNHSQVVTEGFTRGAYEAGMSTTTIGTVRPLPHMKRSGRTDVVIAAAHLEQSIISTAQNALANPTRGPAMSHIHIWTRAHQVCPPTRLGPDDVPSNHRCRVCALGGWAQERVGSPQQPGAYTHCCWLWMAA